MTKVFTINGCSFLRGAVPGEMMPTIAGILKTHLVLEVECRGRISGLSMHDIELAPATVRADQADRSEAAAVGCIAAQEDFAIPVHQKWQDSNTQRGTR